MATQYRALMGILAILGLLTEANAQEVPANLTGMASVTSSRLGKFDVQGIRLGMPLKEASTQLLSKGYNPQGKVGGVSTFILSADGDFREMRLQDSLVGGTSVVYYVEYTQKFNTTFDHEAVKAQVVQKYGEPNRQTPNGSGYVLRYFDGDKSQNDLATAVQQSCYAEMIAAGATSLSAVQSRSGTTAALWSSRGDSAVRQNCPKTLPLYYENVKAFYAPQMGVGVGSAGRGVASRTGSALSINLSSTALKDEAMLEYGRMERERLKTTPPAKADL